MHGYSRLASSDSAPPDRVWKWAPLRFGPFGVFETCVKGVAGAVAVASVPVALNSPVVALPDALPLWSVQLGCCAVLLLAHLVLLVQRFFYKELFSFLFGAFLCVANALLVFTLARLRGVPGPFVFGWSALVLLGELGGRVCYFIVVPPRVVWSDHTCLESKPRRLVFSGVISLLALACLVCQLVVWTTH